MSAARTTVIAGLLRRILEGGTLAGLSEGQLLERFLDRGDEAAFEAIVARHGPMVLNVCRRLIGNLEEAEDAFQATFLILVRRGGAIGKRRSLASWLHGVARRVCSRARRDADRRRRRQEVYASGRPLAFDASSGELDKEFLDLLHAQVAGLPEKYRAPIVLCYFEGRTHEQAAGELDWPVGTVRGRLARARDLLRARLSRRGVSLSPSPLVALLSAEAPTALPAQLVKSTAGVAVRLAVGEIAAGLVSARAVVFMERILFPMTLSKFAPITLAALVGLTAVGAGVKAYQSRPDDPAGHKNEAEPEAEKPKKARTLDVSATDAFSKEAARPSANSRPSESADDPPTAKNDDPTKTKRTRTPEAGAGDLPSGGKRAGDGQADPKPNAPGGKGYQRGGKDPYSQAIIARLDERINLPFEQETPLEDVVKYIKEATSHGGQDPLTIYVDPVGLRSVDKTLQSPVFISLENVPIRMALRLILRQVNLEYTVEDGVLIISSEDELADLLERGPMFDLDRYQREKAAQAQEIKAAQAAEKSRMDGSGSRSDRQGDRFR